MLFESQVAESPPSKLAFAAVGNIHSFKFRGEFELSKFDAVHSSGQLLSFAPQSSSQLVEGGRGRESGQFKMGSDGKSGKAIPLSLHPSGKFFFRRFK